MKNPEFHAGKRRSSLENIILFPFLGVLVAFLGALLLIFYFTHYRNWQEAQIAYYLYQQRYVILAGIILVLVIVQTAVLVAYNISEPIRELSDICTRVSLTPDSTNAPLPQILPYTRRSDEIGQLATAFSLMMDSLTQYTHELSFTKALNESIVENLPLGILVYDSQKHLIFRNQNAELMLSLNQVSVDQGRTLSELLTVMLDKDTILPDSVRFQDEAGKIRNYVIAPWKLGRTGTPMGMLVTIDDVTYERLVEEKMSRDEKLAYTGQLAADVAHEAKNPLAGIRAGLQVISPHLEGERDQKLCEGMIREVDRVNLLIENLVNLSRQRETERTMVQLDDLLDEIELLYYKVTENKGIRLSVQNSGKLWAYADELDLRQILINLINNGLKAMPEGGLLELAAEPGIDSVVLSVRDTGTGMDEDRLNSVLQGEGGGLGLSIVQRLVRQNGGRISFSSEPGSGTLVRLWFRGGMTGGGDNPQEEQT